MAPVEIKGLKKSFGSHPVLKGIDLDIRDGEFVCFLGPSGCGKSTLLRLIAGLEDPTAGQILLGGRDVTDVPSAKRNIAMVFQSYALYPHMSVRKNMAFGLSLNGMARAEIERRVAAAAQILQITDLLDRKPKQLSGASGWQSAAPSFASPCSSFSTSRYRTSMRVCASACVWSLPHFTNA